MFREICQRSRRSRIRPIVLSNQALRFPSYSSRHKPVLRSSDFTIGNNFSIGIVLMYSAFIQTAFWSVQWRGSPSVKSEDCVRSVNAF